MICFIFLASVVDLVKHLFVFEYDDDGDADDDVDNAQ